MATLRLYEKWLENNASNHINTKDAYMRTIGETRARIHTRINSDHASTQ